MITWPEIENLSTRIIRDFAPHKVVLFGSYAYGTPRPDSDVDLLVILPFEGTSFRKSLEILNRLNPPYDVDLIARRPEEASRQYQEGDPLVREALDRGRILYERNR